MSEVPENCPRCGSSMQKDRKPLRIRGAYVGTFEAISCPICFYHYFTDEAYDQSLAEATRLGIVGPPIPEHLMMPIFEETKLLLPQSELSTIEPIWRMEFQTKIRVGRKRPESLPVSTDVAGYSTPTNTQKRIVEAPVAVTLPESS